MDERGMVGRRTLLTVLTAFWTGLTVLFILRNINEDWTSRLASLGRRVPEAMLGASLCLAMARALDGLNPQGTVRRLLWVLGLSLPIGCFFSVANAWALYVLSPVTREGCAYGRACSPEFVINLAVEYSVNFAIVFLAWGAIYLAMKASAQAVTSERRASVAREEARLAELRALRYQVDPHFLFNALNSLGTLVDRGDVGAARGMIGEMGSFLRYGLAIDPLADVELDDEIEMQRRYLKIERIRFAHRLTVTIDVDPSIHHARIHSLLLQPLVENAVKHGVASTSAPVTVAIRAMSVSSNRMEIAVDDDAPIREANARVRFGVGLGNVSERLHARFGHEAKLTVGPRSGGGFQARIVMPAVRS